MAIAKLLADPELVSDRRYGEVLAAFEEVSLATTRTGFDLDDVMLLVGRRLCELLGVSRCSVYLRGNEAPFEGHAGWRRGQDIGQSIRKLVSGIKGDEFTAEIVASAAPVLVTDAARDPRTLQGTMRRWNVRDMVGVPLVVEGDVIGIIYVDNEDDPHQYSHQDLQLAQAFAGLTAAAVRQASLFSELDQRARVIDRQRMMLQHLADTDHRLTRAVLDGADVQALLDLIRDLVGKPVILYSERFEQVAWASPSSLQLKKAPVLSRRAITVPWVAQTVERAIAEGAPTVLPPAPDLDSPARRLICPLTIDQGLAGFLDVVEVGGRLRTIDTKVVERAALTVAMQLLTERRQAEAEGLARQDFLADLLHGRRAAEQLRRRAPLFGLDPAQPHLVVRFAYREDAAGDTGLRRRSRAENLIGGMFTPAPTLLATGVPGADLFVLGLDADTTASAVENVLLDSFSDVAPDLAVDYVIVSSPCTDLGDLPGCSAELRDIATLLGSVLAPPQVALARRFGMLRFVAAPDGMSQALDFAGGLLNPIIEQDQADGRMLETLRAYLDNGGQVRPTARVLDVHENTVRYRLGRLRETLGVDVDDPEMIMNLRFSLRLHDTVRGGP